MTEDTERLEFTGTISQILPGGRSGFVTFDTPLKQARRGFFRAILLDEYATVQKTGDKVHGFALANGAIVAEVVELEIKP